MANKSRSKAAEGYAAAYKTSNRWESNRKRKLERTLKEQPNNEQVKTALKSGLVYRRKTPATRVWSASWIRTAKIIKMFAGKFDKNIMSSNEKTANEALRFSRTNYDYKAPVMPKSMFSLATRATSLWS